MGQIIELNHCKISCIHGGKSSSFGKRILIQRNLFLQRSDDKSTED